MPAPGIAGRLACAFLIFVLVAGTLSQTISNSYDSPIRAIMDSEDTSQMLQVQAAALALPAASAGYRRRSRSQIPPKDVPAGKHTTILNMNVKLLLALSGNCELAAQQTPAAMIMAFVHISHANKGTEVQIQPCKKHPLLPCAC
jgi:hypothetical protein